MSRREERESDEGKGEREHLEGERRNRKRLGWEIEIDRLGDDE